MYQVAKLEVPYALMHMRGDPNTMLLPENTAYANVATEVEGFAGCSSASQGCGI